MSQKPSHSASGFYWSMTEQEARINRIVDFAPGAEPAVFQLAPRVIQDLHVILGDKDHDLGGDLLVGDLVGMLGYHVGRYRSISEKARWIQAKQLRASRWAKTTVALAKKLAEHLNSERDDAATAFFHKANLLALTGWRSDDAERFSRMLGDIQDGRGPRPPAHRPPNLSRLLFEVRVAEMLDACGYDVSTYYDGTFARVLTTLSPAADIQCCDPQRSIKHAVRIFKRERAFTGTELPADTTTSSP